MSVPQVGVHVSIAGSLDLAFDRANAIGATTFQIFTRNPNQWAFKPIPSDVAAEFRTKRKRSGFSKIVAHMPYLPNLASPEPGIQRASRKSLREEVKRCDELRVDYLVVHLGSHLGAGTMVGVRNVAAAVNGALSSSGGDTTVLLENMAGQRNCVGARFEELRLILDGIKEGDRAAVCLDTCHAYAAGFDLSNANAVETTMSLFHECVGLGRLKVVHLNDSKGPLGSNLDRHEDIGKGKIGIKGMKAMLRHGAVEGRPLILETPFEDETAMKRSLAVVRKLMS